MPDAAALERAEPREEGVSRELCCPITHELLKDPVVAEDGETYERSAIAKWFQQGKTRSPVTNEELAGTRLVPNLAVRKLVDQHRHVLGKALLALIQPNGDKAATLDLLQRGALVNIRDEHGATPLLLAISRGRLDIVKDLVEFGADPSLSNDRGENSVAAARRRRLDEDLITYLDQVERAFVTQHASEAETRAREREENRRTQETLRQENSETARQNVPLVPGVGYFPSLFGLQFQGALSATDVAPVYRPQSGPFWSRLYFAVDWIRFSLVGDADLPMGHEDFKHQQLLARTLAGMVGVLIIFVIIL